MNLINKKMKNDLKDLYNPKKYQNLISIDNQDSEILQKMLGSLLLIRKSEQKLAWAKKNNL